MSATTTMGRLMAISDKMGARSRFWSDMVHEDSSSGGAEVKRNERPGTASCFPASETAGSISDTIANPDRTDSS